MTEEIADIRTEAVADMREIADNAERMATMADLQASYAESDAETAALRREAKAHRALSAWVNKFANWLGAD